MTQTLDTEVVLTKILAADKAGHGVSYISIREFCNEIKCQLFEMGVRCISLDISKENLTKCVADNPRQFRVFGDRYYRGSSYDPNLFEDRNEVINKIMERIANSMQIA